jgi:ubiquinone/menaquinone biosynthesis C-methylase UbiE
VCAVWTEKREQQNVFDNVAIRSSNKTAHRSVVWHQDEGQTFLSKVTNYGKKVRPGSVIIDVGCGSGVVLNTIGKNLPYTHYLVGLDISCKSAKLAKQKNKAADFIVCDIDNLPLRDNISSLVIIWNVLHHLSCLESLKKLVNLLDFEGYLIVDDKINGNPLHELLISLYRWYPFSIKMILKDRGNHIDSQGNLPPLKRYSPRRYLKTLKQQSNKLRVVGLEYHGFFLFLNFLGIMSYFFPRIERFPLPIEKVRLFERRKILQWSAISMTIVVQSG